MKPRRTDANTFVYDIPMQDVPMDGIDVKQGGECVYGMHHFVKETSRKLYFFKDRDEVEVHENAKKQNEANIQPS